MTRTFRLLDLPILVSRMILNTIEIEEMDLGNLIAQALKSRKFTNCLLELKKFQVETLSFEMKGGEDMSGIAIDVGPTIFPKIFIRITHLVHPNEHFTVVGDKLFITENNYHYPQNTIQLHCKPATELRIFEQVTKRLKSILKIENFNLNVTKQYDFSNFFVSRHVDKFVKIECQPYRGSFEIKAKDLGDLLENCKSESMKINFKVIDDPDYFPKFSIGSNHQSVNIAGGNWINTDHVLGFDVKNLKIYISENCVEKINKLMKDWTSGKNERMEKWEFDCMEPVIEEEPGLFEGLETENSLFDETYLKKLHSDYEYSMDIRRKTDGQLASIVVSHYKLTMFIWPDDLFARAAQDDSTDLLSLKTCVEQIELLKLGEKRKDPRRNHDNSPYAPFRFPIVSRLSKF